MPSPTVPAPPDCRKRSAIWNWLPVGALLLVVIVFYPQIQAAREAARKTFPRNALFQHSGWHPGAVITIHQDGTVTAGCCPVCYTRAAPMSFLNDKGDVLNEADLPDAVIEQGKREIERVQSTPEWRKRRYRFTRVDEATMDQRAEAVWRDYQARSSPGPTVPSHGAEPPPGPDSGEDSTPPTQ